MTSQRNPDSPSPGTQESKQPDWPKTYEVALALLCLSDSRRRDHLEVRPEFSPLFLEDFEEEGWIEDASTSLDWIRFTPKGHERARTMLEKHFGIVIAKA